LSRKESCFYSSSNICVLSYCPDIRSAVKPLLKNSQGVSLVELLIVLMISGILLLVAIPSYVTYLQQNQIIGTTETLFYTMQYARSEAIKQNRTVYVSFQTGDNWCYGVNPGSACTCTTANSCTLGVTQSNSSQALALSSSGLSTTSVSFDPVHGASYTNGSLTFTLAGSSNAMSVKVNIQGNLQVCSNQISGYSTCS
jgi:type IV fimbrial biogenesis protein FimT